jgi:hypothetical protein
MDVWAALMLVSAGAFAGGAATFSWSRVPIWRSMEPRRFRYDFSATITRTDKIQPALLVLAILSAIAFAVGAERSASALAWIGAAGFIVTLSASVAVLVPLQRQIIADAGAQRPDFEAMRARWLQGHLGRSVLSMASFACTVLAVTV